MLDLISDRMINYTSTVDPYFQVDHAIVVTYENVHQPNSDATEEVSSQNGSATGPTLTHINDGCHSLVLYKPKKTQTHLIRNYFHYVLQSDHFAGIPYLF